jgi:predicted nucleotidyltransferase
MTLQEKRDEYKALLDKSIEIILEKLKGRAERISLFGSYAKGRSDLFTDLDILIIMKTHKSFFERTRELYALLALPVDADILCYTPEEFERIKERGFFQKILKEEVILYEKKSGRGKKMA